MNELGWPGLAPVVHPPHDYIVFLLELIFFLQYIL